MAVHRSEIQSLHVVKRDWRVDHQPEETSAHEIPESNGNEEIDRPFVGADPRAVWRPSRQPDVLPSLETHENQGHDLQRAEYRAQCQDETRNAGEVEMMESSDDATREEHQRRKQDSACCR